MKHPTLDKKFKSLVVSKIRQLSSWHPARTEALRLARITRGLYECTTCHKLFGPKDVQVDHVTPASPSGGIHTWEDLGTFFMQTLACPQENWATVCKPCHQVKTNKENLARKKKKTKRGRK